MQGSSKPEIRTSYEHQPNFMYCTNNNKNTPQNAGDKKPMLVAFPCLPLIPPVDP